jgi:hypothetical protein
MKCGLRPLPQKPIDTILPKLIVNSSEIGSEFGVRQLDGSDDAARQALALTRRYNAGRVFHGLTTQDVFDHRCSNGCTRSSTASDGVHSARSHGRADLDGSLRPSAQRRHSATGFWRATTSFLAGLLRYRRDRKVSRGHCLQGVALYFQIGDLLLCRHVNHRQRRTGGLRPCSAHHT